MASFSLTCPKTASLPRTTPARISCRASPLSSRSSLKPISRKQSASWRLKVQLNDVATDKSLNSAPLLEPKSEPALLEKEEESLEVSDENATPSEATVTAFMNQISDLVKMVDGSSIVELELKQLGCEVTIRKKEAIQQPAAAAPPAYAMQAPYYPSAPPPPPPQAAAPAAPAEAPAKAAPLALPAPASSSAHPPFKCPMAGTFYRCPGPGEPPYVKVGDVVKKGQILCIVEAMKLMNEIEADRSGTVTEVIAEDGKPVSVNTPLFVIAP